MQPCSSTRTIRTAAAWLTAAVFCSAGPSPARGADVFAEATARLMAGDAPGAVAAYEGYLTTSPRGEFAPLAALAAGNLRREALADPAGAIASYDRVLAEHPASPWACEAARRKGECLENQEQWASAGEAYRQAVDLSAAAADAASPVPAAWLNEVSLAAANCYYQLGDRQKVVETYEHALAGSLPGEARATTLYRLGLCHEEAGDTGRAARRYREVLESYPLAPEFLLTLEKRAAIESHEALDWAAYEAYAGALRALRQRDLATSLQRCDAALAGAGSQTLKQHAEYCRVIGETITSGDYGSGVRRLENLRRRMPRDAVPRQMEQTIAQYEQTARLEAEAAAAPEDGGTLLRLGQRYLQSGSLAPAVEKLERALALDPQNDRARFSLGQAYGQLGDVERSAAAYDAYLTRNPNDVTALNLIGYAWINSDPQRAIPYFQRYAELAPDDANAHDSLGEGYLAAGRLEEAAAEYERAVALDPTFTNSYFMLGQAYQQLARGEQAAGAYRRFIELTGGSDPRCAQAESALRDLGAADR